MQVKCIGNRGTDLSDKLLSIRYTFLTTKYDLEIEQIYTVYGIYISNKGPVLYLIQDIYDNWPDWYPADLFITTDHLLPLEWYYNFFGYDNCVSAIWGYKELALNLEHYNGLIEREDKDMEIFFKRKREIDDFAELVSSKDNNAS